MITCPTGCTGAVIMASVRVMLSQVMHVVVLFFFYPILPGESASDSSRARGWPNSVTS